MRRRLENVNKIKGNPMKLMKKTVKGCPAIIIHLSKKTTNPSHGARFRKLAWLLAPAMTLTPKELIHPSRRTNDRLAVKVFEDPTLRELT
jgi:hypothetical protein